MEEEAKKLYHEKRQYVGNSLDFSLSNNMGRVTRPSTVSVWKDAGRIDIAEDDIQKYSDRRKTGRLPQCSPARKTDSVKILSGTFWGRQQALHFPDHSG